MRVSVPGGRRDSWAGSSERRPGSGAVIALSLLPAARITFGLWSDLNRDTRFLGANPVKEMEHFMGAWNIRFLVLTLAVSPLIKVTG